MTSGQPEELPCWSYRGSEGPDHWGHLHPDWKTCAEGSEQSPVALPGGAGAPADENFALHYQTTAGRLSPRTHTVQVDLEPGSRLTLGEQDFFLRQFHFHTPSEHLWSEAAEAGEIHLVHVADSGEIIVLGVALRADAVQVLPESFWGWLRAARADEASTFDPTGLVPRPSDFLIYRGSLTTPPCTEGVRWLLAREPMAVGPAEQEWLRRRIGRNARPAQPLGDRVVHSIRREWP